MNGTEKIYSEILKLPPTSIPPNYYELLGTAPGLVDEETIRLAARKRAALIKRHITPELQLAGRQVMQQLRRAAICLLDANARAAYDQKLGIAGGTNQKGNANEPKGSKLDEKATRPNNSKPSSSTPKLPTAKPTKPKPGGPPRRQTHKASSSNTTSTARQERTTKTTGEETWVELGPTSLNIKDKRVSNTGVYVSAGIALGLFLLVAGIFWSLSDSPKKSSTDHGDLAQVGIEDDPTSRKSNSTDPQVQEVPLQNEPPPDPAESDLVAETSEAPVQAPTYESQVVDESSESDSLPEQGNMEEMTAEPEVVEVPKKTSVSPSLPETSGKWS